MTNSIVRVSETYQAPTLVDGRPVNWLPSSTTTAEWGTLRVEIGAVWDFTVDPPEVLTAGTDITEVRGAPVLIDSLSWAEPYGETTGQITLPGITELASHTDDLAWLDTADAATIDIWHVKPDTSEIGFWHGFVASIELTSGPGITSAITLQLAGALTGEAALRAHQPFMLDQSTDIGTCLARALDPVTHARPLPPYTQFLFESATTGIDVRHRGSRGQMVLDACDELLAMSGTATTAWTIAREFTVGGVLHPRKYLLVEKADYVDAIQVSTIHAAGRGVALSLSRDYTERPNAIYGEGTDPDDGSRWRNAKYPALTPTTPTYPGTMALGAVDGDYSYDAVTTLQARLLTIGYGAEISGEFTADTGAALSALQEDAGVTVTGEIQDSGDWDLVWSTGGTVTDINSGYFLPLAVDKRSDFYLYAPDGAVTGDNDTGPTAYDGRVRVDRVISFGDRISKSRATAYAKRLVNQSDNPSWIGTVTLTADPIERPRWLIREGQWITVKFLTGTDVNLYVAGVQSAPESEGAPVTLTVASQSWDLLDLTARIERNRSAADNPAKSFYSQRTRPQRPWRDVVGWDKESGAGIVSPTRLAAGWNVIQLVGAQYGTIAALQAETYDSATKFAMALFGAEVTTGELDGWVADPLAKNTTHKGLSWWSEDAIQTDLAAHGFIEAWGEYKNACGYAPGAETDGEGGTGHALTGKVADYNSWEFASLDPPYLWLAVWVPGAATPRFKATMRIVVTE